MPDSILFRHLLLLLAALGRLVDDHFYLGPPWTIGLKRFLPAVEREGMYFYFRPMPDNPPDLADIPADVVPEFGDSRSLVRIHDVEVVLEYEAILAF